VSEFFPGSRQPITGSPAGLRDLLGGLSGKTFTIAGKEVELFSISELAEVLNRKPVTLRKWEQKGIIPKATFVKPGANQDPRGRRRLYSREQVLALVRLADEEGILHDLHKQVTKTQFRTKAWAAFREIASQS
jgi:hypothetical protein